MRAVPTQRGKRLPRLTVLARERHRGAMTAPTARSRNKGLLIKLAILGVILGAGAILLLRGVDLKAVLAQFLAWLRSVGPVGYFVAMAVLPAIGFPVLFFSLSAGPAFAPQLGMGVVIACTVASLVVNLALTYWLSRYAFRPLLEGIIKKLGYQLPQVAAQDHLSLTVLLRITPGPPFFVQGYLLGLADVPFLTYMWVSCLISISYNIAVVLFGDSLTNGKGGLAFLAFSLLIAFSVLVKWIRRRMARKKLQAA
jgi:uncharacterized membrane protein YdjX (TVP38/TMEM64 family)